MPKNHVCSLKFKICLYRKKRDRKVKRLTLKNDEFLLFPCTILSRKRLLKEID